MPFPRLWILVRRANPLSTLVKLGRKLNPTATKSEAELSVDRAVWPGIGRYSNDKSVDLSQSISTMSTAMTMVEVVPTTKTATEKALKSGDASPIRRPQYDYFANAQVPTPDLALDFTTWIPSETVEEIDDQGIDIEALLPPPLSFATIYVEIRPVLTQSANSDSASAFTSTSTFALTPIPSIAQTPTPDSTPATAPPTGRVKWASPPSQTIAPIEERLGALAERLSAIKTRAAKHLPAEPSERCLELSRERRQLYWGNNRPPPPGQGPVTQAEIDAVIRRVARLKAARLAGNTQLQ
ncbi:hypothetical protein H4R33_006981 [Dimargaris cristalligena]|nr:hypothetical protein H4R33_006981 [Dimargaris cristalligena]